MYGTSFIVNLTGYVLDALRATGSTLLNGLVSYWPLDEVSGTRYDLVGSNDLTDNNTVGAKLRGPEGTVASYLLANNERLTHADDASLRVGIADFTFSFWYNRQADTALSFPLAKGTQTEYVFDTYLNGMRFYTKNGGGYPTATWASALDLDAWYFVVGWRDGAAQTVNLQINGGAVVSAATGAIVNEDAADPFVIGAGPNGQAGTHFMNGVGFWTRILTSDERTALFASGNGLRYADLPAGLTTGLVSWWELDEVSGVRYDSHGSNDLTDNNTVGSVNSGPKGVVANFVTANNEYLSRAITTPDQYSISLWCNSASMAAYHAPVVILGASLDYTSSELIIQTDSQRYDLYSHANGYIFNSAATAGWHLLTITHDKLAKAFRLFIDAVEVPTSPYTYANSTLNGDRIAFGAYPGGTQPFDGPEGNIGYWEKLLTPGDVSALFAAGRGKRYADLTDGEKVGLVSYWNLDEQSGVRYDSHGANDLTDNNTVGSVINAGDAMDGAAASFVAANSETLSAAGAFDSSQPYTLAFWVNGADTIANGIIWINGNTSTYLLINGAAATWYHEKSGGFSSIGHQSTISAGWHLLICEMDGSALNYYMDNVASASNPVACVSPTQSGAVPFALGGYVGYMTTSRIDEPAIWDRVLTEDERTELFNLGRGRYYAFD